MPLNADLFDAAKDMIRHMKSYLRYHSLLREVESKTP
jgi:hypothetical protein